MVQKGARNIILVSRNGFSSIENQGFDIKSYFEVIDNTPGVSIRVESADLSTTNDLQRILNTCALPIGGIFLLSGYLQTKLIPNLEDIDFQSMYQSKIGVVNTLLELINPAQFDFCILFSSLTSTLGCPGSAHYAAANAYLDHLGSNIPNITTVCLPTISKIGMFHRSNDKNMLNDISINPQELTQFLTKILLNFKNQPSGTIFTLETIEPL